MFDPENKQFLMETNLPTPKNGRVYVNLLEGISNHIYLCHYNLYHHYPPGANSVVCFDSSPFAEAFAEDPTPPS